MPMYQVEQIKENIEFYLLSLEQYLKVYTASLKDKK